MTKQNDEKKKEFERLNYPSDRFDSLSLKTNRTNEETLSAIEEGRRIAADAAAPAYKTIEELKAALKNKNKIGCFQNGNNQFIIHRREKQLMQKMQEFNRRPRNSAIISPTEPLHA